MPKKAFKLHLKRLRRIAQDLRYLLDRGYHKDPAVNFLGNRWRLHRIEREILKRAVFSTQEAQKRRQKILPLEQIPGKVIHVDTYNLLYTVESALLDLPVFQSDDGMIRDVRKMFSVPRLAPSQILDPIFELLEAFPPEKVVFFLDRPVGKSGQLALRIEGFLEKHGLRGEARLVEAADQALKGAPFLISSDAPLVDQAEKVFDLAGKVILKLGRRPFSLLEEPSPPTFTEG